MISPLTRQAIQHTWHCLIGCGIGEILGSVIGAGLEWPNAAQTTLAVVLAFVFGYGLTFWGGRRMGLDMRQAAGTALRTDTISIASMETIDNVFLWLAPGAMDAAPTAPLFWWSLAVALAVAFVLTVPINRWLMARAAAKHGHAHTPAHEHHMHH